jgi:hypothetical protein
MRRGFAGMRGLQIADDVEAREVDRESWCHHDWGLM